MDKERKRAWNKLYQAENILKKLRADNYLYPLAKERPPYPTDSAKDLIQYERIGFFEGHASAFYNTSAIERDYFEMWYFDNLAAFKGSAHGDESFIIKGHEDMDKSLKKIKNKAEKLRAIGEEEKASGERKNPEELWFNGEYTEYNREHN